MKIVQAVNAMISKPMLISGVIPRGMELFFMYADKYKWSINQSGPDYFLFFYAGDQSLEQLARMDEHEWDEFSQMVRYSTDEIQSREALSSFQELYRLVKERQFGVDAALDDIISTTGWN